MPNCLKFLFLKPSARISLQQICMVSRLMCAPLQLQLSSSGTAARLEICADRTALPPSICGRRRRFLMIGAPRTSFNSCTVDLPPQVNGHSNDDCQQQRHTNCDANRNGGHACVVRPCIHRQRNKNSQRLQASVWRLSKSIIINQKCIKRFPYHFMFGTSEPFLK